jgi:SAM-dependent methyltransferase
MLSKAGARAQTWGVPFACHEGLLDALPGDRRYDFIVVCSVLHHVPDLPVFLGEVRAHQSPGGVFLHLQDPNGDFLQDPERLRRSRETGDGPLPGPLQRFTPRRILGRLYREVTGKQHQDAVSKTNRALLDSRLIATPLSVQELYAITDIHVHDGRGISIRRMTAWLPEYECLSARSYGYFGKLWSVLPPHLRKMEDQLIERKEPNGLHVGAIWKLSERPC